MRGRRGGQRLNNHRIKPIESAYRAPGTKSNFMRDYSKNSVAVSNVRLRPPSAACLQSVKSSTGRVIDQLNQAQDISQDFLSDKFDFVEGNCTGLLKMQVPDSWKAALIRPLLKKLGLELVYKNFGPVSNLPMVSKSAEKVVVGQLFRHCSDNAPLSNMDKQEVTLLVLLDLSAAFDTVDHNILINILESDFGICGDVLKWFTSYLTGRVQRVIVNQQSSKTFNLNYGVPQGSCLGPVLFLLYAARMFEVVKKHLPSVYGYADDTQLYVSFRPDSFAAQDQAIKAIENCIADVRAWLVSHMLMFNDSKTEFLIIGSSEELSKVTMASIKVGDCDIQPKAC